MSELDNVAALVRQLGWLNEIDVSPAGGTGNNRVFCLSSGGQRFLLKRYFQHPADPRDRFGAERAFYKFCDEAGITWVPKPVGWDIAERVALFEYVEGTRPTHASEDLVGQALSFFSDINAFRPIPAAAAMNSASEACFSIRQHLQTVERRIQRLGGIAQDTEVDREAAEFVSDKLLTSWKQISESIASQFRSEEMDREIPPGERCITPSDFGFHNAILQPNGRLRFFDFEYAGWDDPAKTICDFFCQPAVPVSRSFYDDFTRCVETALGTRLPHPPHSLLPLYQIKWCCIMLNEFLPNEQQRRAFSAPHENLSARKLLQLQKVKTAFKIA